MRISILGNSDTRGSQLPPGELPWPAIIQERLEAELGEPIEIDNWRFAPYRPAAAAYGLSLIDDAEPDCVVLPMATYWCAFATVEWSVRDRFGMRASKLYAHVEAAYKRQFDRSDARSAARTGLAPSFARKVFGSAPLITVPQFIDVYSELIRDLSRRENLQVIVFGDRAFSTALSGVMPEVEPALDRVEAAIKPLVIERRLQWVELERAFDGERHGESLLLEDGIHMTPEAQKRTADLLLPIFSQNASRVRER